MKRRTLVFAVPAAVVGALLWGAMGVAAQVPVDEFPNDGWFVHPTDQTAGGAEQFVTGPGTPPLGVGSLQMTVAGATDIAKIMTVPQPLVPLRSWGSLTASFATYTDDVPPTSSPPVLQFGGFQSPGGSFTTLNVEPSNLGTVLTGQWQTWTLGATTAVWQTGPGVCQQSAPCPFSDFVAAFPTGWWDRVQVNLGALGGGAPATGYVDAVMFSDGSNTYFYDFEPAQVPPATTTTTTVASTTTTVASTALVRTGSNTGPLALWAAVLVVAGIGARRIATRRSG
jgi:hypothetical protein